MSTLPNIFRLTALIKFQNPINLEEINSSLFPNETVLIVRFNQDRQIDQNLLKAEPSLSLLNEIRPKNDFLELTIQAGPQKINHKIIKFYPNYAIIPGCSSLDQASNLISKVNEYIEFEILSFEETVVSYKHEHSVPLDKINQHFSQVPEFSVKPLAKFTIVKHNQTKFKVWPKTILQESPNQISAKEDFQAFMTEIQKIS